MTALAKSLLSSFTLLTNFPISPLVVPARLAQIHGFSAHADRDGLLRWLSGFKKSPRHIFVTYGESQAASFFSKFVREKTGWETSVPDYLDEVILE
ncbi:MBL fold metallo-hydrolase RNA specificity domain-containing protein [Chloroflexota bacterium]